MQVPEMITNSVGVDDYYEEDDGGTRYRIVLGTYYPLDGGVDYERCDLAKIKTSADILDNMSYKIADSYNGIKDFDGCTKDSTEKLTINGLDATKWKGQMTLSYDATGGGIRCNGFNL